MAKITTSLYGDLALIPNIAAVPVTETLNFVTDQIKSYDGSEQNIQLRTTARQKFHYTIPIRQSNNPDDFNTSWGGLRQKWAVPVWTDLQNVGNISAGASFILCDTTNYDLRASSLAMVLNLCGGTYQILEITTIASDRINFSGTTVAIPGAMLVPVRVGYVNGDITREFGGYMGKISAAFDIVDTQAVTPAAPDQYLSNDIYYDPGLLNNGLRTTAFNKREDVIDFDIGIFEKRSPWTRSKFRQNYRSITTTPAERTTWRNFIYRRLGKSRQFWLPTFENNLRLKNTGTIVSTLVVSSDSYIPWASDRVHIAIQAAGVWYPRVISSPVVIDSTTIQLTLSSAINIPASSVSCVSFLGLNRLDTDTIEMNYGTPFTVETNVSVLELQP